MALAQTVMMTILPTSARLFTDISMSEKENGLGKKLPDYAAPQKLY